MLLTGVVGTDTEHHHGVGTSDGGGQFAVPLLCKHSINYRY